MWPSQDGETVEFVPIRFMGPRHAPQGHMHIFSSHFGALEHVAVVQIYIMDYIKCIENLVISNIYTMAKRTLNSFKFQPDTPVILCCL